MSDRAPDEGVAPEGVTKSTEAPLPDHLAMDRSGPRGFAYLPPLPGEFPGQQVVVYESSAADGPHLWMQASNENAKVTVSLDAEVAWRLAEQIMVLCANHYQGDARPSPRYADLAGDPERFEYQTKVDR